MAASIVCSHRHPLKDECRASCSPTGPGARRSAVREPSVVAAGWMASLKTPGHRYGVGNDDCGEASMQVRLLCQW